MSVEALVVRYGLIGIFLGAGVEGEAVVVTGGVLAHKHLVPLWGAMLASATGSCIVDQIWFFVGRYFRNYRWVKSIMAKPAFARAKDFLERHPNAFIFGFRFIYGLRTVSPIAIGAAHISLRRFLPLNMLAAAIWGPLFTIVGYAFGEAVDPLLGRIQSFAIYAIGGLVLLAMLWLLVALFLRRRAAKRDEA